MKRQNSDPAILERLSSLNKLVEDSIQAIVDLTRGVGKRFDEIDVRLDRLDSRFARLDDRLTDRIDKLEARFSR